MSFNLRSLFRVVTMYETNDGKLHPTPEDAKQHVLDQCCELLDSALDPLVSAGKMSRREQIHVVETLAPDVETIWKLVQSLQAQFTG